LALAVSRKNDIGTHEWRASMSYVSGAHNMKFGYQGGFSTPTKNYFYDSTVIQVRTNNGIRTRSPRTSPTPAGFVRAATSSPSISMRRISGP
jgi:hypothetical protein